MESVILILVSIVIAAITAYAVATVLVNQFMRELDELEKEHRKQLLDVGIKAINDVKKSTCSHHQDKP